MEKNVGSEGRFTVINDEGKEVECEILFTFESEETQKNYIVYTDNTTNEEGNTKVFASTYASGQNLTELSPVESEKEWAIIESILDELQTQVGQKQKETKKDSTMNLDESKDMDEWIATMSSRIDSIDEDNISELFRYSDEINKKIFEDLSETQVDELYKMLGSIDSKLSFAGTRASLGMEAYSKGKYELAERAFKDTNSNNNLAYIIRRGEVKDPAKYSVKYVAELLKESVHEKEPFSMVNMALLWVLNVKGEDCWRLADNIISMLPSDNVSSALDWWLDVANKGDVEGYLVHYWMLKKGIIDKTPLGTKEYLLEKITSEIKDFPDFMK